MIIFDRGRCFEPRVVVVLLCLHFVRVLFQELFPGGFRFFAPPKTELRTLNGIAGLEETSTRSLRTLEQLLEPS